MRVRGFEIAKKVADAVENGDELLWDGKLPERATEHSAGYDFYAAEDVRVPSFWGAVFSKLFVKHSKNDEGKDVYKAQIMRDMKLANPEETKAFHDKIKERFKPTIIHTGIKAYMEGDEALFLYNRSSNPLKLGLVMANSVGVIDSDYYSNSGNDGEIMFEYYNFMPWAVKIKKGDKVGQGVFQKYLKVDNDNATGDRTGGIGSTNAEGTEAK